MPQALRVTAFLLQYDRHGAEACQWRSSFTSLAW
jgi:hypothetical protein